MVLGLALRRRDERMSFRWSKRFFSCRRILCPGRRLRSSCRPPSRPWRRRSARFQPARAPRLGPRRAKEVARGFRGNTFDRALRAHGSAHCDGQTGIESWGRLVSRCAGWLVGFQGRADYYREDRTPAGSGTPAVELAGLIGRRLRFGARRRRSRRGALVLPQFRVRQRRGSSRDSWLARRRESARTSGAWCRAASAFRWP